ncbi:MAG: phosphoenolpyruvate carboxylase [Candidatus Dormibacteraeota bacterium]|nr:phosphoenolpyruvate carboxylase [Candidatus Dormibacteraeota bacterium]
MEAGRERARQEMPPPLRREVRLLGEMLGQVLRESGAPGLFEDVERLRRTVIAGRHSAPDERAAEAIVAAWSAERAEHVARAFTCYFHLANLAEERQRVRALRERDRELGALPESMAATVRGLREEVGEAALREQVEGLRLQPVLTAHPTEARRRAVVVAIAEIGGQLDRLDDPRTSRSEERDVQRRLLEEIDVLWRTEQLRGVQLQPLDEVRALLPVFEETLFRVVPDIYRALDTALSPGDAGARPPLAPAFVRIGSWVGGDRDGNPNVTAEVTAEAMRIQSDLALRAHEVVARRLGRSLTAGSGTPASPELAAVLREAERAAPAQMEALRARAPGEVHRHALIHLADRLAATRTSEGAAPPYGDPDQLLRDLQIVQASLAAAGAARLAYGELQHLIWRVQTFGFHLAELEVRQHSAVHEAALAEAGLPAAKRSQGTREVLATLRVMADLQRHHGPGACRRYIVSFTRGAADIAAVYELARLAGGPEVLDVVPLFETGADLDRCIDTLDAMLALPAVERRLRANARRLEVMLGYSDSAKEGGPVFATFELYRAQARLAAWAQAQHVELTLFHGRGGALGRGGGPANRAVLAQAPGSVAGRFKVTEQGEVIFARYGNADIARRHLEQVTSAVLTASSPALQSRTATMAERFAGLAGRLAAASLGAYRELLDSPGFAGWFAQVTPLDELGRLRLGSRPQRRSGARTLEGLRAIPWVFAWSQARLNLPGYYGLGSGLAVAEPAELREAYVQWPLFRSLIDNAEMSLAKTDRRIAARYLALGDRPDLSVRVLAEYDLTIEHVLATAGHHRLLEDKRVLGRAVDLRNPYVDALSHLQLRALRGLRAPAAGADSERERLERLLLLTVNGVAAGLQNTG